MSAADTAPATAVDSGEDLVHPLMPDQTDPSLVSSRGKAGLYDAYVHKGLGESSGFGAGADHAARRGLAACCEAGGELLENLPFRQQVIAHQLEDLQISSPPDRDILRPENSSLLVAEPYSPASPSSCPPPAVYFAPLSNYKPPPTMPGHRELYYDELMVRFTARAMEAFKSVQDEELNLEYQSIKFAENSVEHHNNNPDNEVKYELINAMESTYMFESDSAYVHVNFTARPKKDCSKEQLFFAELRLQGEMTFLTCFHCLKEEDQIGGRMEMDREGKGIDLEQCYACRDALKHPRDGESYRAGHRMKLRCYECP